MLWASQLCECSYVPVKEMNMIDVNGISNNQLIIITSHAKSDKYVAVSWRAYDTLQLLPEAEYDAKKCTDGEGCYNFDRSG